MTVFWILFGSFFFLVALQCFVDWMTPKSKKCECGKGYCKYCNTNYRNSYSIKKDKP